jgi:hypothetical protein
MNSDGAGVAAIYSSIHATTPHPDRRRQQAEREKLRQVGIHFHTDNYAEQFAVDTYCRYDVASGLAEGERNDGNTYQVECARICLPLPERNRSCLVG